MKLPLHIVTAFLFCTMALVASEKKSDITITVIIEKDALSHIDKSKGLPLTVTVKNISRKSVEYMTTPPPYGVSFYFCDKDSNSTPLFVFYPPLERTDSMGWEDLAPGASKAYTITIPFSFLKLHSKKTVASIHEFFGLGSQKNCEAFSKPFELPDLK